MLRVLADDANYALTLNNLALVANLLHRSSDFHCIPLLLPLPVSIQNPPTRQVVRRQLHQHTVSREDLDVMHTDLPRNMSQQLMASFVRRLGDLMMGDIRLVYQPYSKQFSVPSTCVPIDRRTLIPYADTQGHTQVPVISD